MYFSMLKYVKYLTTFYASDFLNILLLLRTELLVSDCISCSQYVSENKQTFPFIPYLSQFFSQCQWKKQKAAHRPLDFVSCLSSTLSYQKEFSSKVTVLAQVGGLSPNSEQAGSRVKGPTDNLLLSGNSRGLNVYWHLPNTRSNNYFFFFWNLYI